MMQFNEQDLHYLRDACIKFQNDAGSSFLIREYDTIIRKLDRYRENYECPECTRCVIHR